MIPFQRYALVLVIFWLALVAVRFRRSTPVLVGGLLAVAMYAFAALLAHRISPRDLGLSVRESWMSMLAFTAAWLALMLAYSPIADWIATRFFDQPPTLGAFRALQQSRAKLMAGIVVAWVLGGFLEELVFRGVVLQSIAAMASRWGPGALAAALAIVIAAAGAGILHLYQGPRAALVVTQLSVLFGVLFVLSGYNLWTVILCHGAYDTIAFIRFASGKSRYARFAAEG